MQDARPRHVSQVERAGKALGFTLDAEVCVSADNRLHRERLCRYLLRPPLAKGRLHETMDGKYAFELKTAWSDGTRVIFFSGEELVARLAALVPPPRMHLVHYYGVLAPNAKLRPLVVPEAPQEETTLTCGAECIEEERAGRTTRRRWVPWAELLLKGFSVDVVTRHFLCRAPRASPSAKWPSAPAAGSNARSVKGACNASLGSHSHA